MHSTSGFFSYAPSVANGWRGLDFRARSFALGVGRAEATAVGHPTLAGDVELALFCAGRPECGVCHNPRGWIWPANGWTPMVEEPPHKKQHVAWRAREDHTTAGCMQRLLEIIGQMIMPFATAWGLLRANLVTAWPDVECPMAQRNDALHAPKVLFISVGRSCLSATALKRGAHFIEKG